MNLLVITGGSRGIGRATAQIFKNHGYEIVNLSRSSIDPNLGTQIDADFSRQDWTHACKEPLVERVKDAEKIVCVHNASVLLKDNIETAASVFSRVMQTNVIAAQQLNELLLEHMPQGSSIHYVGSTLSEKAVANTMTYSTSKHAILGLMRATCQDLAGSGIHTTCVCPGFTDTEMLRDHLGDNQEIVDSISAMNGFNRLVQPEEIAETIYFCANNPAMNGSVIHANLGQREQ